MEFRAKRSRREGCPQVRDRDLDAGDPLDVERLDRLQLLERRGRPASSRKVASIRAPRTPMAVQLSSVSSRTWSCPDRRKSCPKGLSGNGGRRQPWCDPWPFPVVKRRGVGVDRGEGRFQERRGTGGAWRCRPGSRSGNVGQLVNRQDRAAGIESGLRRGRPAFGGKCQERERETGRSVQLVADRAHQDARARREGRCRSRGPPVRTLLKGWTGAVRQRHPGGGSLDAIAALPPSCEEKRGRPRSRRWSVPGEDANWRRLALRVQLAARQRRSAR